MPKKPKPTEHGEPAEANAAFIVTAVNSYDRLQAVVSAAEELQREMQLLVDDDDDAWDAIDGLGTMEVVTTFNNRLRVALAAVRGGEGEKQG